MTLAETLISIWQQVLEEGKEVVVLDGIDILPDGFRIRCHDLHGQLPEIVMGNSGDTFPDKDRLAIEACKLIVMVKLRDVDSYLDSISDVMR